MNTSIENIVSLYALNNNNWPLERVLLSSQGRFDLSTAFTVLSWDGKL